MKESEDNRTPEQLEEFATGATRCAADARKQAAEILRQADEWETLAKQATQRASHRRAAAKAEEQKPAPAKAAPKSGRR